MSRQTNCLVTKEMKDQDLISYKYPSDEELEWAKLKIVYLGYYIKDFTRFTALPTILFPLRPGIFGIEIPKGSPSFDSTVLP